MIRFISKALHELAQHKPYCELHGGYGVILWRRCSCGYKSSETNFLKKFFQRRTTQEHALMSLEQAVNDNTVAVKALTEVIGNYGKPGLAAAPTPTPAPAGKGKTQPAPVAATADGGVIDYASVVAPKVLETSKKAGREVTVAILASFTGANGQPVGNTKEVQSSDYAALMVKLQAAIDGAGAGSLV